MAKQNRAFYCLRCQHRFSVDYDPQEVMERSCPSCGSNSVRLETAASALSLDSNEASARKEK